VQQHGAFPFPQFQGWFTASLAEAYRLDDQVERAQATAGEALEITRAARSLYGVALALRALGRSSARSRHAGGRHRDARGGARRVRGDPGALRQGARVARPRGGRPCERRLRDGGRSSGARPPALRRAPRPALSRAGRRTHPASRRSDLTGALRTREPPIAGAGSRGGWNGCPTTRTSSRSWASSTVTSSPRPSVPRHTSQPRRACAPAPHPEPPPPEVCRSRLHRGRRSLRRRHRRLRPGLHHPSQPSRIDMRIGL
jgi:hypothetical protein